MISLRNVLFNFTLRNYNSLQEVKDNVEYFLSAYGEGVLHLCHEHVGGLDVVMEPLRSTWSLDSQDFYQSWDLASAGRPAYSQLESVWDS
jgi:hypothetical protein